MQTTSSLDSYLLELEQRERAYEIERLKGLLPQFGLTLAALVQNSPRHNDTRDRLKAIALRAAQEDVLVELFPAVGLKVSTALLKAIRSTLNSSSLCQSSWVLQTKDAYLRINSYREVKNSTLMCSLPCCITWSTALMCSK